MDAAQDLLPGVLRQPACGRRPRRPLQAPLHAHAQNDSRAHGCFACKRAAGSGATAPAELWQCSLSLHSSTGACLALTHVPGKLRTRCLHSHTRLCSCVTAQGRDEAWCGQSGRQVQLSSTQTSGSTTDICTAGLRARPCARRRAGRAVAAPAPPARPRPPSRPAAGAPPRCWARAQTCRAPVFSPWQHK
jgi:hypothetical protein